MSIDRLQEKIDKLKNPTVVGLDPAMMNIPPQILDKHVSEKGETLEAAAAAVSEWGIGLIDSLYDIVPAIKPQSAYYEALGPEGVRVLKTTCDYARSKGMYVICDGKRNDIGTTAQAYSAAYLGAVKVGNREIYPFDFDALTVNAYLGSDGIKPFIEASVKHDKAIFVLVRTSNPSAGEFQDLLCDDKTLYTTIGCKMEELSRYTTGKYGFTRVGAVVGATYPEETEFLREQLKHTFFLIPGYGAQGGTAADAARAFGKNGRGAIVSSSRAVIAAWKKTEKNYKTAARDAALQMRGELCGAIAHSDF